jgi:hypothetical protein
MKLCPTTHPTSLQEIGRWKLLFVGTGREII